MCFESGGFESFAARWERAFQTYGTMPHQSPGHIRAESSRAGVAEPTVIEAGGVLSAFRVKNGTALCLVEGAGVLPAREGTFDPDWFLSTVRQRLGVDTIHIPLLYPDVDTAQALLRAQGVARLERLPTLVMAPPFDQGTILARCSARLGSRARRRICRFRRAGLVFQELAGDPAIRALDLIEQRSWKATCRQDMHSRDQFAAYAARLRSGELSMTAVMAQETPIAYRIDAHVRGILFALKWSFDEAWRRVSPGFVLLAVNLPWRCEALGVKYADLFGSPDLLKGALSTGERRRIECAWPAGPAAERLLAERRTHDTRAAQAHAQGNSIRSSYV
jgi:Acetyltransferase (GNAT) domain